MVREKTRDKIISAGKHLLWQIGIRKLTVEEVCEKAGVSKMTFYRAFESKEGLTKAVFSQHAKQQLQQFLKMKESSSSFKELMEKLIEMKHRTIDEMGEFLVKDLASPSYQSLLKQLKEESGKVNSAWENTLQEAIERKELRQGLSVALVTYHLNQVQQQLQDPNYIGLFSSESEAMHEAINMFFHGLMGRNE